MGELGATGDVLKSYEPAKDTNSAEEYCGPLSLLTISGIPCLVNMLFRTEMMPAEVVEVNLTTSGYRE